MKPYLVTLCLIVGYYDSENENPIIKQVEYTIQANSEAESKRIAKETGDSKCTCWESFCEEI